MNNDIVGLKEDFRNKLLKYVDMLITSVSTNDGDWVIKGFIDIAKNIYIMPNDTKVISKIMELLIFPTLCQFAKENSYFLILCKEQNHYPDVTFVDKVGNKFALDLKTTYQKDKNNVNGMTLGAFTGYFRNRKSNKNIHSPYDEYIGHFVLGIIYTRSDKDVDETQIYQLESLQLMNSVAKDFKFFCHEKYKIAIDRPGSGNTKNIGSVNKVNDLINGLGPFVKYGVEVFDDYWMYYLTNDMARAADLQNSPYKTLNEYLKYKNLPL